MKGSREAISVAMRFHIMRRDGFTCQYCGAKAPDTALHVDHVVPVVAGGTNDPDNLIVACVRCNIGKGAKDAKHDGEERPETERERRARVAAHLDRRIHSLSVWVATLSIQHADVKAVLYALAHSADPAALVTMDLDMLAHFSGMSVEEVARICAGLEAVGLILPPDYVGSCLGGGVESIPPFINAELHVDWSHADDLPAKPPYNLSDFSEPACFSIVEVIH